MRPKVSIRISMLLELYMRYTTKLLFRKIKAMVSAIANWMSNLKRRFEPRQKKPTYFSIDRGVLKRDGEYIHSATRPMPRVLAVNGRLTEYGKYMKECEDRARAAQSGELEVKPAHPYDDWNTATKLK